MGSPVGKDCLYAFVISRPRRTIMNDIEEIIIGSRGSALALEQARIVEQMLARVYPRLRVGVKIITTEGDKNFAPIPLDVVGKEWFTKEIESELLRGGIDIAVHSLKDLPAVLPDGLAIVCVPERIDVRDVLVSQHRQTLRDMPAGAVIGTDSARRKCQLLHIRPDVVVRSIRGNINTRLEKLKSGLYDAIVLAAAGLKRLGLEGLVAEYFDPTAFVPAPGQGALAIEASKDNHALGELLQPLFDPAVAAAVSAERTFSLSVGGGCKSPTGAYGVVRGDTLRLIGMIGSEDGSSLITDTHEGRSADAMTVGRFLGDTMRKRWNNTQHAP